MSLEKLKPRQLADEWAYRVQARMQELGIAAPEIEETVLIIHSFTQIAVEQLVQDPWFYLPNGEGQLDVTPPMALQVIDLFLRGVNQASKRLRDLNQPWAVRREHLEAVAWKLFNLAKLLVGLKAGDPAFSHILSTEQDLKSMMRQSVEELLDQEFARIEPL